MSRRLINVTHEEEPAGLGHNEVSRETISTCLGYIEDTVPRVSARTQYDVPVDLYLG
jgi:hypothetical protein